MSWRLKKLMGIDWFTNLPPIEQFSFIVAIFTVILAITTIANVWFFIQSERPILGITDIRFAEDITVLKNPLLIIEISNKGKTTAFIRDFRIYGDDGVETPSAAVPRPTNVTPIVLPSFSDHVELDIPKRFSQEEINRINDGAYHIWIIGVIKYTDRFGWFGGGEFGFCFYYNPARGRGVDSFYRCHEPRYEYAD